MTRKSDDMRLRYDEGCLAVHALNQIGDRWALLVVRELTFVPKRFQMLRHGLPGITAGVLTARLVQLQKAGVVEHDERLGVYSLSEAGRGLLPVLEALCRWALTIPGHDPSRFISPTALMISMGVNLQRQRVQEGQYLAGFAFGKEAFEASIVDHQLVTVAVARPKAPFVLKSSGNGMAAAVYGPVPLSLQMAQGTVGVEGDIAAAQTFLDLFQLLPQPA
ncbi:helix-turn-helix transcriptional regulator [Aureimonas fodinaquatilis]|uniref:Helix-turn-helix transcriptional regulator n=1 Tax=Aureimonas fodinaquatilis TaxID=2565783 RepID=A0A5B0DTX8_9HYPH|nr:helix-turn-helix domain-containing protein [Aureimonas fodinaquatilis]KAA0970267.1 helix-turn-helix transcriptional regulator [Aureimonas fodinaquatilis]